MACLANVKINWQTRVFINNSEQILVLQSKSDIIWLSLQGSDSRNAWRIWGDRDDLFQF
jgi:hypothetical protein